MQNNEQYGLMVWEDIKNIPFYDECKKMLDGIDWHLYTWNVYGVPEARYCMSQGKILYLTELKNGESKLIKLDDFTGTIIISTYLVDKVEKNTNYLVEFSATLLYGEVVEVKRHNLVAQSAEEYNNRIKDFEDSLERVERITSAFWFRFLYKPWFYFIRVTSYGIIWVLAKMLRGCTKLAEFLTPI